MDQRSGVHKVNTYVTHGFKTTIVKSMSLEERPDENIQCLDRVILSNNFTICNSALQTAHSVIHALEEEIKALRCRNENLEQMIRTVETNQNECRNSLLDDRSEKMKLHLHGKMNDYGVIREMEDRKPKAEISLRQQNFIDMQNRLSEYINENNILKKNLIMERQENEYKIKQISERLDDAMCKESDIKGKNQRMESELHILECKVKQHEKSFKGLQVLIDEKDLQLKHVSKEKRHLRRAMLIMKMINEREYNNQATQFVPKQHEVFLQHSRKPYEKATALRHAIDEHLTEIQFETDEISELIKQIYITLERLNVTELELEDANHALRKFRRACGNKDLELSKRDVELERNQYALDQSKQKIEELHKTIGTLKLENRKDMRHFQQQKKISKAMTDLHEDNLLLQRNPDRAKEESRRLESKKQDNKQFRRIKVEIKENSKVFDRLQPKMHELKPATAKKQQKKMNKKHMKPSLAQPPKDLKSKSEHKTSEIVHSKELDILNANEDKEIEMLKQQLKNKEVTLQFYKEQYEYFVNQKENEDSKLNDSISKQKDEARDLQGQVDKLEASLKKSEQDKLGYRGITHELSQSKEKVATFVETINELQNKGQENEDLILRREIDCLQIELDKRNTELADVRQLRSNISQVDDELRQSKEMLAASNETIRELEIIRKENENQIIELKHQLNKISEVLHKKETKTEWQETNISMQNKLKRAEHVLEHSIRKQIESKFQDKCIQLQKELDRTKLDLELTKKECEQEKETSSRAKEQIKEMIENIDSLDGEIQELKEKAVIAHEKEAELSNTNRSLQIQLKIMETKSNELQKKDKENGNQINTLNHQLELSKDQNNSMTKMQKEIETLKLKLNDKEITVKHYSVKYEEMVKQMDEEKWELQEKISNQSNEIQNFQNEIDKKDMKYEQEKRDYKSVEHALSQMQDKVAAQDETIKLLQNESKENMDMIAELKEKLNKNSEALYSKEIEFQQIISSLQNKESNAKDDLVRCKEENKLQTGQLCRTNEQLIESRKECDRLQRVIQELKERSRKTQENENKLANMNHSLQMQLKSMETESKQIKLDVSQIKEQENAIEKSRNEIEAFKIELKDKEVTIQKYQVKYQEVLKQKKEEDIELKEVISKHERQIQQLQIEIDEKNIQIANIEDRLTEGKQLKDALRQSEKKSISLGKTKDDLEKRKKEHEMKINELKDDVERCKQESKLEKERSYRMNVQMKENIKEMESLKLEIPRLKEISKTYQQNLTELQNTNSALQDVLKHKEQTESKQKEIIERQNIKIQHLEEEVGIRNNEISSRLEEERLINQQTENALNKSRINEEKLRDAYELLKVKNQSHEDRISQLTHYMNEILERKSDLENINHTIEEKNKHLEKELVSHRQGIAKEKAHSMSLRTKMAEISKENDFSKKEIRRLEHELQNKEMHFHGIIDSQAEKIKQYKQNIKQQEDKVKYEERETSKDAEAMENKIADLKDQLKHILAKLRHTETELDETKSRLSRVMGDKLTDNNPNITDLSDRNRPTKIAEKCAELYDNQWTDAYDVLEKHFRGEEGVIEALLHILQDTMSFCKAMAKRQMETIKRQMNFANVEEGFEVSSEMQKSLKDQRKAMASSVVGNLYKIYVSDVKKSQDKDKVSRAALEVDEYTSECIEMCWYMVVQDPPVVFAPLPKKGARFDTGFYKPYTKMGTHVEYSVWPSLLLHEGGPILAKGVAQGCTKNK